MNKEKNMILALDSTAEVSTVSICDNEKLLSEITINTGNTHSQTLLPAVEHALNLAEIKINDVDVFACSVGPGSFTGVRIGVATIKGIAYGKNKPCIPVSALDALAYNLIGFNGIISPVMNARRSQVYNALFKCENGTLTRICPDRALSISELDSELCELEDSVYLCGDGYDITLNGFIKTKPGFVPMRSRFQSAYSVAQIAISKLANGEMLNDFELAPIYLRPSQAERERQARINAESKQRGE